MTSLKSDRCTGRADYQARIPQGEGVTSVDNKSRYLPVMTGLDPGIHAEDRLLSTHLLQVTMDHRVEPGGDDTSHPFSARPPARCRR
jgi:hypothetical protein